MPIFEGVYVLQDLDVPDAKRILEVESLFEGKVDFEKEYGHGKFAVSDLLWCSSMMFSNIAQKIGSKRLFLFTCEDSPHQGDQAAQLAAKTKAKDLADLGIEVELFNMNKPKERFNIERFYAVSAPSSSNKPRALLPFFPGGGFRLIVLPAGHHLLRFGRNPRCLPRLIRENGRASGARAQEGVQKAYPGPATLSHLREHLAGCTIVRVMLFGFPCFSSLTPPCLSYNLMMETKKGAPVNLDGQSNNPVKTITKYTTVGSFFFFFLFFLLLLLLFTLFFFSYFPPV